MKAFLLAAGKGERLKPLTDQIPKPLINIKGKPLIEWNIERLARNGIKEVIINVFHLGHMIEDFLGDGSKYDVRIIYSKETALMGTGGAILNALDLIGSEPFLLMSSDIWTNFPFKELKLQHNSSAHMVLVSPTDNIGDFNLEDGIVNNSNQGERYTYSGISKINPKIFLNKKIEPADLWKSFISPEVDKGLVTGEFFDRVININYLEDIQMIDDAIFKE